MYCIKSLLKHILQKDGPRSEDPTHTPASSSQTSLPEIPLEKIFGTPEKQNRYTEHRLSTTDTASLDGVSAGVRRASVFSINYRESPGFSARDFTFPIVVQTEIRPECEETAPTLQFSIIHDVSHSVLHVFLLEATNLPESSVGESHTSKARKHEGIFVTMYLHPSREEILQSKVVSMSQNPKFEEGFEFSTTVTAKNLHKQSVVFLIYRGTKASKGAFCGSVVLPLGEADLYGVKTIMNVDETGGNLPVSIHLVSWDTLQHLLSISILHACKSAV